MELLRGKTIVVAAADEAVRAAVCADFGARGCQTMAVPGAVEAYELARAHHVDAVLTAYRLSSGDVRLLLSDIRRLSHETPVILFGAAGESLSQTEALDRGFAGYFLETLPSARLASALCRSFEFVEDRKKKRVERVSVAAQAELTFGDAARPRRVSAPVLNLSRGGLFLSLEEEFPAPQSEVRFALAFPTPHPLIEGRALVRWVREKPSPGHLPGLGLEFTELSPEARTFIDGYVERSRVRNKA